MTNEMNEQKAREVLGLLREIERIRYSLPLGTAEPTVNFKFVKRTRAALEWAMGEVERLTKESEWQPIETAPRDETIIDIFSASQGRLANYMRVELRVDNVYYQGADGTGYCIRDATHWMLLPPLPAPEGQKP